VPDPLRGLLQLGIGTELQSTGDQTAHALDLAGIGDDVAVAPLDPRGALGLGHQGGRQLLAILVQAGNPEGIETLADMCGKKVALQRGTANEDLAVAQNEECDEPIEILAGDQDSQSLRELQQGRAVAVITDYPVALYNALTAGGGDTFEVVGEQIDAAPYGIAVPKDNNELRDALQAAVQEIIDNGKYAEVLDKWDAQTGAIDEATVNAGM
jgi:polar amino acid transport system substrate-binding protein